MWASSRFLISDGEDGKCNKATGIVGEHAYCLKGAYELYMEDGQYRPPGEE
jgi:hypothetical protein